MGESGRFTVDLAQLNDVVGQLRDFTSQIEGRLDDLSRQTTKLHVEWTGVAATAHRQAHDEWSKGAREMAEGLTDMQEAAANAHSAYQAGIDANTSMFR